VKTQQKERNVAKIMRELHGQSTAAITEKRQKHASRTTDTLTENRHFYIVRIPQFIPKARVITCKHNRFPENVWMNFRF